MSICDAYAGMGGGEGSSGKSGGDQDFEYTIVDGGGGDSDYANLSDYEETPLPQLAHLETKQS